MDRYYLSNNYFPYIRIIRGYLLFQVEINFTYNYNFLQVELLISDRYVLRSIIFQQEDEK